MQPSARNGWNRAMGERWWVTPHYIMSVGHRQAWMGGRTRRRDPPKSALVSAPGHAGAHHSAAPRELGSFAGVAMAPCMSLGSPFTPCGPLRPAVVSGSSNSSRRQYRIKRSVTAAAAPRNNEGDAQRVAVSAVLGALFGSLAPKQDPNLGGDPSPAGPKLGNVVGAVMAAFVLVRGPPGVGPWWDAGGCVWSGSFLRRDDGYAPPVPARPGQIGRPPTPGQPLSVCGHGGCVSYARSRRRRVSQTDL